MAFSEELEEALPKASDTGGGKLLPALFIGHGNPMNALFDNPFTETLRTTGEELDPMDIKAICVISAHWLTRGTYVCTHPSPRTIHDFLGFPAELYEVTYPAPGSPRYANRVAQALLLAIETEDWGLDHGSWTILRHMFPRAKIPVFQLSIDLYQPMDHHYKLARMLKPLRREGVLFVGSGNIVHNLPLSIERFMLDKPEPFDWAVQFDQWVKERLEQRDFASLLDYANLNPQSHLAVPTIDHYVPMIYIISLIEPTEDLRHLYEGVLYGGISMRAFMTKPPGD